MGQISMEIVPPNGSLLSGNQQTFLGNVPRKGGKRPSLDSWASMAGRYMDTGPELHINGGPGDIKALGKTLKLIPAMKELQDISFGTCGGIARLSYTQRFGDDPKFIRALYKVAISVTAFWLGPDVAGSSDMAAVRKFVRNGRGAFRVLLLGSSNRIDHHFTPPWKGNDNPYMAVGMRVFGVDFVVDFDPEQRLIALMEKLLIDQEAKNWTTLPVAA